MSIDTAVRHVDRELQAAREALAKATERTQRVEAALSRARADEDTKLAEVRRLEDAKALLTGEARPKRTARGRPTGEDPLLYDRFVGVVERIPPEGRTRTDLRSDLGVAEATIRKYIDRALREGRLTKTDQEVRRSPVYKRTTSEVVDISLRRSA